MLIGNFGAVVGVKLEMRGVKLEICVKKCKIFENFVENCLTINACFYYNDNRK